MKKKSLRGRLNGDPNPVDLHVGNRVRIFRTLKGFSQERLGTALGLTFQQVQKYEKGMNRIGASRLWDISQVLQTPIALFYEDLPVEAESLSPRHLNDVESDADSDKVEESVVLCDDNPLMRRETLELVRAYYQIGNRAVAHKLLDLVKSMAPLEEGLIFDDKEEKKE